MEKEESKLTDIPSGNDNYHKLATNGKTVTTNKERRFNRNSDKMQET